MPISILLKELLSLTDGNLASHTRALEELGLYRLPEELCGEEAENIFPGYFRREESFQNSHRSIGEFSEINIDVWLHTKPDNTKYLT